MTSPLHWPIAMCLGLMVACGGVRAELRLDAGAFVTPPPCRVEPFLDDGVGQYLGELERACGGQATRIRLAPPAERAGDIGPGLLKAGAYRVSTRSFGPVSTTLKLAWAGRAEHDGRVDTEQALLAAGALLRFDADLALRAHLGLDAGGDAMRQRTRLAGLWRPRAGSLLFAEWAGHETQTEHHAVGMRWYLVPKRVALDIGARRTPWTSGWAEPRIGLLLPGLGQ